MAAAFLTLLFVPCLYVCVFGAAQGERQAEVEELQQLAAQIKKRGRTVPRALSNDVLGD